MKADKNIKAIRDALSGTQLVCSKQCDQCLFSKHKIVDDKRAKEILHDCERDHTHFICHKGSISGLNLVCAGFYRNKTTPFLELMKAAGKLRFVDPMTFSIDQELKGKQAGKKRKMR